MHRNGSTSLLLSCLFVSALQTQLACANPLRHDLNDQPAAPPLVTPQIFALGVVSGPANDGTPAFSPEGNTIFFTRTNGNWSAILESHLVNGQWSHPTLAPFSGQWPDSAPAMSPDGSYLIFESRRPLAPLTVRPRDGEPIPGIVSNLWRVDRTPAGWSQPARLPGTVNLDGQSIWKCSIAADGAVYSTVIDSKRAKRIYVAQYKDGAYQQSQPLPFSDGTTEDVDPEIAPDGSFLIFASAKRLAGDELDHLFIVARKGEGWGPVVPIRYAGDDKPAFSTDNEPHLSPDRRTLYFSSDRAFPTHYPRTPEQAQEDFKRQESSGWFSGYSNVWIVPVEPYLNAAKSAAKGSS
jgi:Tol biopolymer transport system component